MAEEKHQPPLASPPVPSSPPAPLLENPDPLKPPVKRRLQRSQRSPVAPPPESFPPAAPAASAPPPAASAPPARPAPRSDAAGPPSLVGAGSPPQRQLRPIPRLRL